jgi:hypothetical protein
VSSPCEQEGFIRLCGLQDCHTSEATEACLPELAPDPVGWAAALACAWSQARGADQRQRLLLPCNSHKVSTEAPSPRKCTRAIKVWRQCRKRYGPEDPDKTQWVRERSRPRRRGIWDDCSQARHGHSDGRLRLRPDSIPGTDE